MEELLLGWLYSFLTVEEQDRLLGLADLERLEDPWLEEIQAGDPENVAITLRLLMAHMAWISKRLMGAMVLDRLDVELATTRLDIHNDVHGLGMSTGISTDP